MPKLSKITFIIIIISVLSFISCNGKKEESSEINIFTTLPPFKFFASEIVGNRANVNVMIPPGANAHSFEPSPRQIKNALSADLYFGVGKVFNLEKVILKDLTNDSSKYIDCSTGINIVNDDPHYWLSPANVKLITKNMVSSLIKKYPQHKNYFNNNRISLLKKVDSLDNLIKQIIDKSGQKSLIVYHSAWNYFTQYYGLKEIAIEKNGKEPKAKEIIDFMHKAKESNAKVIFFDPHYDDNAVITVAESVGLVIDTLDPLPNNYIENMEMIETKFEGYFK